MSFYQAHAEILFLDFNGAPGEIAAAERAAKARGEKLIILPKRSAEQVKAVAFAEGEFKKAQKQYMKTCRGDDQGTNSQCNELMKTSEKKYDKIATIKRS